MKRISKVFLLIMFLLAAGTLSAATYHVSTTGDDGNDGLSWAAAFATVQKGINEANTAGSSEVWVSQGTYSPTEYVIDAEGQRDASDGNEYMSFKMYGGVNVYGGFAGTEGSIAERALVSEDSWDFTNPTILDGMGTSYHVVWFGTNGFHSEDYEGIQAQVPSDLASQSILDGFTVTGGFAAYPATIEDATAPKNNICHYSGGGIAMTGKSEVHNCIVESNRAKHSGAGIGMQNDSKVYNSLIQDNEAVGAHFHADFFGFDILDFWRADGAGITARGNTGRPLIDGCTIQNNKGEANNNYPGIPTDAGNYNLGGGVALHYADITNSLISSNEIKKAPYPYGGTDSGPSCGGGIYLYENGTIDNCEVTDNGFVDNVAQNGAGIFLEDYSDHATTWTDIWVKNSYVHSNRSGGAIANDAHYSQIENTLVANNIGSGIYGYGNCNNTRTINCISYNNSGAGWSNSTNSTNSSNWLINSTIVNNGTGIGNGNTGGTYYVRNSVAWGNNSNPLTPNIQSNYSAFDFTPPTGTNNIQIDADNALGPKFVNPTATAGVGAAGWENANWRVDTGSPVIDTGLDSYILPITAVDIAGGQRLQGNFVDMGAYEFVLYQLTLTVDPVGTGVVVIQNNSGSTGLFAPGTDITIKAAPSNGQSFWKWTYQGATFSKLSEYAFTMPAESVELVGHFSENPDAPSAGLPSGMDVPIATTQMSWTAPASGVTPTNYKIYLYSDADGYTAPLINGIETPNTYYDALFLEENTTYLVKVHSEFDPDYKGLSDPLEWYFKTENFYTVDLSADPTGGGVVLIQNNGGIAGDFSAGEELNITATPEANYTFWKWTLEDVTVSAVANFTYTVPESDASLIAYFYEDPDAPTNGTPTGTDILLTVDLGWDAPASGVVPTSYLVYLYSDADLYATPIIDGAEVTATEYTELTLAGETTYKVMVYSKFDPDATKGTSGPLTWFFTTEVGPDMPDTPIDLTITGYTLDWTASTGATSYYIYSSDDPYAETWTFEEEVIGTTWTDAAGDSKKFYKVTAVN